MKIFLPPLSLPRTCGALKSPFCPIPGPQQKLSWSVKYENENEYEYEYESYVFPYVQCLKTTVPGSQNRAPRERTLQAYNRGKFNSACFKSLFFKSRSCKLRTAQKSGNWSLIVLHPKTI
jgi:hypothetical protein